VSTPGTRTERRTPRRPSPTTCAASGAATSIARLPATATTATSRGCWSLGTSNPSRSAAAYRV
jgi:hypothetical protein